jgi:hypothetical protein
MAPGDAKIGPTLAQLPQLTSLQLGMVEAGDHFSATRAAGGWRVFGHSCLQPGVAAALARSFSGAAGPVGQQEQLVQHIAAEAAEQTSIFDVGVEVEPGAPSSEQASELASLGRALAAFDAVALFLGWEGGQGSPVAAHALLQPVAARLVALGILGDSSANAVLGALQRQPLPRLARLSLSHRDGFTPGSVTAVAGLDAPRLTTITLDGPIAGSRTAAVAAVSALAMGRPQPVGPDGRPAGLAVEVNWDVLSDEELVEVCAAVAAVRRPGRVTLGRS